MDTTTILLISYLIFFVSGEIDKPLKPATEKAFSIKEEQIKRESVMVLNERNFEKVTSSGHTFIKFYAPWCGHCQMMEPDWEEVGEFVSSHQDMFPDRDLTIGEIDCVANSVLCLKEAVDAYPTIKMYKPDNSAEEYVFARSGARMKRFLVDELIDVDNMPSDSIGIFKLNEFTFEKFINKNKVVLVKFHIPGCQHCVTFKTLYDDLVIKFLMEEAEDVKFAEVNCLEFDSVEVCSEEGVSGFPALHLYKDGMIEDVFSEERTSTNLENFVWQTVDPDRVEEFDPLSMMLNMNIGAAGGQEEFEECDCSEPDCDCDDEDYEDYEDEYDEEDNEEAEEDEEESDDAKDFDNIDGHNEDKENEGSNENDAKNEKLSEEFNMLLEEMGEHVKEEREQGKDEL